MSSELRNITRAHFENATIIKDEHECGSTLEFIAEASTLGFFAVSQIFVKFALSIKIFDITEIKRDWKANELISAHYIEHATGDTLVVFND